MKRAGVGLLVLAFAAVGITAAACAGTDETPEPPAPMDNHDASIPPAGDAGGDDAPDAEVPDASPPTCSIHGFCHTELPGDAKLEGVWGDGTGIVWAVSLEGNVLRWDGSAWKVHASGLGPLRAIWGSGPTDIWLGGENVLLHGTGASSDALTFAVSPVGGDPVRVTSIWGTSATDVWAAGRMDSDGEDPRGEVLRLSTSDAGASWAIDPVSEQGIAFDHVWGTAASGTWISGSRQIPDDWVRETVVFRKTSGDFAQVDLPIQPGGDPIFGRMGTVSTALSPEAGKVVVFGRTVSSSPARWTGTSSDGEQTFSWTFADDGTFDEPIPNGAYGTSASDMWTAGEYGRVRHWDGTSWSPAAITVTTLPVIDPFHGVWGHGSSELWMVGDHIALRYDPTKKQTGGAQ